MGKSKKKKNKDKKFIDFSDAMRFSNILSSAYYVENGKKNQHTTAEFHTDIFSKSYDICRQLMENIYKIKKLYSFTIYEPKKRNITANQFEDKIIHRVACTKILEPVVGPKLIYDNYASQPNKGTKLALDRISHFMRSFAANECDWGNEGWIFSGDIHHYFYEIDREICMNQIKKLPIDEQCVELIRKQVYAIGEYDGSDKGICIGFQTSQWLAVYYLNGLDHFIKEKLHIKYYGRYMDNFYIIHKDKEYIQYCVKEIDKYLKDKLNLELNPKSNIHPFSQGLVYLGFHFTYNTKTHDVDISLLKKNINRMLKKTNKILQLIDNKKLEMIKAFNSHQSWYAYGQFATTNNGENAHQKALKIINRKESMLLSTYDSSQRDREGFIQLRPRQIRDSDGFIILKKRSKGSNPFPYKQKKSKKYKCTKSINESMRLLSIGPLF